MGCVNGLEDRDSYVRLMRAIYRRLNCYGSARLSDAILRAYVRFVRCYLTVVMMLVE